MHLEFEEKLKFVKKSAASSMNTEAYKRKLAAQRLEFTREMEKLKHEMNQLQGRKRQF